MTTYRRYNFLHPGPRDTGHDQVVRILTAACLHHHWYRDPSVEGLPFGRLSFSFTVAARDQWWAHQRALKLAVDCYYAMGLSEHDVPEPDWEALAPHTNRGHRRVPAASASTSG